MKLSEQIDCLSPQQLPSEVGSYMLQNVFSGGQDPGWAGTMISQGTMLPMGQTPGGELSSTVLGFLLPEQ